MPCRYGRDIAGRWEHTYKRAKAILWKWQSCTRLYKENVKGIANEYNDCIKCCSFKVCTVNIWKKKKTLLTYKNYNHWVFKTACQLHHLSINSNQETWGSFVNTFTKRILFKRKQAIFSMFKYILRTCSEGRLRQDTQWLCPSHPFPLGVQIWPAVDLGGASLIKKKFVKYSLILTTNINVEWPLRETACCTNLWLISQKPASFPLMMPHLISLGKHVVNPCYVGG